MRSYVVTGEQLEDMRHALGWSQTPNLSKVGWRNHYYAGESDLPRLRALVIQGLMTEHPGSYFAVTLEGARFIGVPDRRLKHIFPLAPLETEVQP